jgi:hypothetical protein
MKVIVTPQRTLSVCVYLVLERSVARVPRLSRHPDELLWQVQWQLQPVKIINVNEAYETLSARVLRVVLAAPWSEGVQLPSVIQQTVEVLICVCATVTQRLSNG